MYRKSLSAGFLTLSLLFLSACNEESIEVVYERPGSAKSSSVQSPSSEQSSVSSLNSSSAVSSASSVVATSASQQSEQRSLPSSVLIRVPFTSQAPFGDWGEPYQEACEEAALIMVQRYLTNQPLSAEQADDAIVTLTGWIADQNLAKDVTVQQLARVAKEYYGLESTIVQNPTVQEIQQYIADGEPVIVPAAGRTLGNPYFSGEGPWYHMLVIIGYNDTEFITNDPGTRRGEHYRYSYDTLMNAIHNWTGVKQDIENGERVALIVHRN